MSSKQYFDSVAEQWDNMRTNFFSETVRDKAIEKAILKSGTKAADLGAGTGFITEGLLNHDMEVYAVDQSREMLTVLEQKFSGKGSIKCFQGQAEELPLENHSVDYVFANMYLHHVEDPGVSIQEMFRILAPGGKVIITDLDLHQFDFLLEEHNDRWPGFERKLVEQWLADAGFKDAMVECINQSCCADSNSGGEKAEVSIFIASGSKP